jgi:hypothetical protein
MRRSKEKLNLPCNPLRLMIPFMNWRRSLPLENYKEKTFEDTTTPIA